MKFFFLYYLFIDFPILKIIKRVVSYIRENYLLYKFAFQKTSNKNNNENLNSKFFPFGLILKFFDCLGDVKVSNTFSSESYPFIIIKIFFVH